MVGLSPDKPGHCPDMMTLSGDIQPGQTRTYPYRDVRLSGVRSGCVRRGGIELVHPSANFSSQNRDNSPLPIAPDLDALSSVIRTEASQVIGPRSGPAPGRRASHASLINGLPSIARSRSTDSLTAAMPRQVKYPWFPSMKSRIEGGGAGKVPACNNLRAGSFSRPWATTLRVTSCHRE